MVNLPVTFLPVMRVSKQYLRTGFLPVCVLCCITAHAWAGDIAIALLGFDDNTRNGLSHIATAAPVMLYQRLSVSPGIRVFNSSLVEEELQKVPDNNSIVRRTSAARNLGADFLLTGDISEDNGTTVIGFFLFDTKNRHAREPVFSETIAAELLVEEIDALTGRIARAVEQYRTPAGDKEQQHVSASKRYAVHVSSFRDKEAAVNETKRYRNMGFDAYAAEKKDGMYPVMIGRLSAPGEAERAKRELYRLVGALYSVHAASFRQQEKAVGEKQRFLQMGFDAFVDPADLGEKGIWYRVMIGRFLTREQAQGEEAFLHGKLPDQNSRIIKRDLITD